MVGILFAIKIAIFALCAGAVISFIIFVPLAIYCIPYWLWLGSQNTKGRGLDRKKDKPFKAAKHATILYSHWIRGKKPSL